MSLLGFHVASSKRTGAGDLLTAGAPVVVMVDQNMIGEVHLAGAIAAYRTQRSPMGEDNPSNFMASSLADMPTIAAQWMNSLKPLWDQNPGADYYIVNNEQDIGTLDDAAKLAQFFISCMGIADQWGIKVGICSFSSGNPSDDGGLTLEQRWQPMLPAIKYCADHKHVIVLHAHCLASDSMMHSGESEALRHQRTLRYFAANGLHPKVIIGELSNGVGGVQPDLQTYIANVTWWDEVVMASEWRDQVIGGALYGFNAAETITSAVPDLVTWISEHPTPVTPPPPPPPPVGTRGDPRIQYPRTYNVIPANVTDARAAEIFLAGWQRSRETAGGSYDDGGIGNLDSRTVNLWDIPAAQQQTYRDWYAQNYPGVVVNFK